MQALMRSRARWIGAVTVVLFFSAADLPASTNTVFHVRLAMHGVFQARDKLHHPVMGSAPLTSHHLINLALGRPMFTPVSPSQSLALEVNPTTNLFKIIVFDRAAASNLATLAEARFYDPVVGARRGSLIGEGGFLASGNDTNGIAGGGCLVALEYGYSTNGALDRISGAITAKLAAHVNGWPLVILVPRSTFHTGFFEDLDLGPNGDFLLSGNEPTAETIATNPSPGTVDAGVLTATGGTYLSTDAVVGGDTSATAFNSVVVSSAVLNLPGMPPITVSGVLAVQQPTPSGDTTGGTAGESTGSGNAIILPGGGVINVQGGGIINGGGSVLTSNGGSLQSGGGTILTNTSGLVTGGGVLLFSPGTALGAVVVGPTADLTVEPSSTTNTMDASTPP